MAKKKKFAVVITLTKQVSREFNVRATSKAKAIEIARDISNDTEDVWEDEWFHCWESDEKVECHEEPYGKDSDYDYYDKHEEDVEED